MSLDTQEHIRQTWGSHMPLLSAVMSVLRPKVALECGCGNYSTPIMQNANKLITIEHDIRWASNVKRCGAAHPDHQWIVHAFDGIDNSKRRADVRPRNLDAVDIYYAQILNELPKHIDFVFVDTLVAARVAAVNNLSGITDMLMLHDTEGASPAYYDYHLLRMSGWFRYRFAPTGMKINGVHEIPWTDIFTRDLLAPAALLPTLVRESRKLWGEDIVVSFERIDG